MRTGAVSALIIALLAAGRVAHASVVVRLSPEQLYQGAEVVVEGTVHRVESRWKADRSGLETLAEVAVQRVLRGSLPATVYVWLPGGRLEGRTHIIVGMPELTAGEEVRLYLRRLAGGTGKPLSAGTPLYRIFGWAQGKWTRAATATASAGGSEQPTCLPAYFPASAPPAVVLGQPRPLAYTVNGMLWPPDKIPVPYLINSAGTPDVPFDHARAAIRAAFATWAAVPCSTLSYREAGETQLGMAVDGQNVIVWIESDWLYGEEAAAATSLWIPIPEERTADIAFNGQSFDWAIGPAGKLAPHTLDIQAVLTHELGHFNGLGHTESALDTMYYSWKPWPGQRTLSADDKQGLCSLYPRDADECASATECASGETCERYQHGTLCTPHPDPIGAACNYDRVECESFCLFTSFDLSSGYCSRFCQTDGDCPPTHHCAAASAGGQSVRVCFTGAPRPRDGGADGGRDGAAARDAGAGSDRPADGGGRCTAASSCPAGQYCSPSGLCSFDCRLASDCASGEQCNQRGRCVGGEGGGCSLAGRPQEATRLVSSSTSPQWSWAWLLLTVVVARLTRRRRRNARPGQLRPVVAVVSRAAVPSHCPNVGHAGRWPEATA